VELADRRPRQALPGRLRPLTHPIGSNHLARNAGLPAIRLHDVRHSYATAALAAGVPAKVVSERLGHANIAITLDVYSHVIPGMDAAAANAVASLILDGSNQSERPGSKPGPSTDK
jgi:integrase